MTLRPLPVALALSVASLSLAPRASADDELRPPLAPQVLPAPPASTAALPEMRSMGLVVGGLVVGGLGAASALAGLALMHAAPPEGCATITPPGSCGTSKSEIGTTMLLISAPVVAGGVIMAVLGAQPKPGEAPKAHAVPEVALGPTGGTLRWRF